MKNLLKYVLGVVLLLGLAFVLIGIFKPSLAYSNQVEVNKPAKEAWAVMMDGSKTSQWFTGFKNAELQSGKEGEEGAVSKITVIEGGKEKVMMETILAVTENEHIEIQFDMDEMVLIFDMNFIEKDGKTTIKSDSKAKGKGMFMKSTLALMKSAVVKQDLETMTKMKKVIEENATDYFGQANFGTPASE